MSRIPKALQKPAPQQKQEEKKPEIKEITIPEKLTIRELAEAMKMQPSAIVKKLFMEGQMVTVNHEIDFEQAEEIALGFDIIAEKEEKAFDPETQFFYEEYILALRCQRKGYNIVYDPSMSVKHESGAATKKSYGTEKKRIRFMMEKTVGACEVYLEMLGEE